MSELRYLDRGEGKVAFEDYGGSGPLVVCAPGMGDLRSVYRFVAPTLSEHGFHVVTVDLRGMGDSSPTWSDYSETAIASDLLALVDHLGGGPATLVGNSISAGAAVCAAADAPERVASLVLVGPFVRNVPLSAWKLFFFRLALARPWGAGTWANYQRTKLYPSTPPADMDRYSDRVRSKLREPGRMVAFQRMASTDHTAAEARLDRVHAPGLVVMGTRDPDFPDPKAEAALVARRLGATVALMDGAGHYPQAESPDRFCTRVLGFLGEAAHVA